MDRNVHHNQAKLNQQKPKEVQIAHSVVKCVLKVYIGVSIKI